MAIQPVDEPVPNPRWVMPAGADRIFVSIGVSNPGGGLEQLPGAITASVRMDKWAQGQGYATLRLNDTELPKITTDILRVEITKAIETVTDNTELMRLVIFFAGHGAAQAIGDQYWILSNWQIDSSQAIKVTSLQRMLEYYGPRQVSLIGDACQEFSSQFIDIVGSAVLYRTDEQQRYYELDQFFAVDVGKQAFMIKANGEQEDFCLFTEVLLDALEGDAQGDYFDTIDADKVVTSQSLARYLKDTVAKEAGKYGVQMNPCPRPGFYTDKIYLRVPNSPRPSPPEWLNTHRAKFALYPQRSANSRRLIRSESRRASLEAQIMALKNAREASRDAFAHQVKQAYSRVDVFCGLTVSGADVAYFQASFDAKRYETQSSNTIGVNLNSRDSPSLEWCDSLVTLTDGRIVPVCLLDHYVAYLHIIDAATLSLLHCSYFDSTERWMHQEIIRLLASAQAGLLSRENIIDCESKLYGPKGMNIMMGCIAAQLYDVVRDVDSLRSMAAVYVGFGVPVPLDIILYGGGTISERNGRLFANIPAVAAREPRTPQEQAGGQEQPFSYSARAEIESCEIAGRIPWMRQAWGAVATARCDASAEAWRKQALTAMEYLAPGLFTVAKPSGHAAFIKLAGIKEIQDELTQSDPLID